MAEAVLELDISSALDAIADLSGAFDEVAIGFGDSFSTTLVEAIMPQVEEIGEAFSGISTEASESLGQAFSGVNSEPLVEATENAGDLDTVMQDLTKTSVASSDGFNISNAAVQGLGASQGLLGGSSTKMLHAIAPGAAIFAGVAASIGGLVDKADNAQLALDRMKNVFGSAAPTVFDQKLQGLNFTLGELNTKAGGSNTGLRLATATFGSTAIAAGATREEAAQVTQQMGALSAIVTTLNPSLGTADKNFQLLSRGLGGSTRVLQRYGIQVDAATQAQMALQIAQEHGREKASLFDKQVAGSVLAMKALNEQAEASGTTLQQQLNKGLDSSTIKFRAFKQQISSTLTDMGAPLIEPVLKITETLTPVLLQLITLVGKLASSIVPAFVPLAQGLATILSPLGKLADLLDELPEGFSTVIAALVALKIAGGPLGSVIGGISTGFASLSKNVTAVGPVYGKLGTATGALAEGLGRTGKYLEGHKGNMLGAAAAGLVAAQSFDQIGKSAEGSIMGIGGMAVAGAQMGGVIGAAVGTAAGIFVGLGHAIFDAGESVEETRKRLAALGSELDKLGAKRAANKFIEEFLNNLIDGKVRSFTNEIRHLAEASPAAARKVVDGLQQAQIASGEFSASGKVMGTTYANLYDTIDKGEVTFKKQTANSKEAAAANAELAGSATATGDAVAAAQQKVTDAGTAMAASAKASLPSVSSAFDGAKQSAEAFGLQLSPEILLSSLQESLTNAISFAANLKVIFDAGLIDLGQLLQEKGAVAGGSLVKSLADAIKGGEGWVAAVLNEQAAQVNVSGEVAAQYATTQGQRVVQNQADQYARLAPIVGHFMGLTANEITGSGPALTAAAQTAVNSGIVPFEVSYATLVDIASGGVTDAAGAVQGVAPVMAGAAGAVGTEAADSFSTGVDGMKAGTSTALDGVSGLIVGSAQLAGVAATAGRGIGLAFVGGMSAAIENDASVQRAARGVVTRAETAARAEAESDSPSKLFARLGKDLAAGVSVGITAGIPDVVKRSENMIARSAAVPVPAMDPRVLEAVGAQSAARNSAPSGGSSTHIENNFYGVKDGKDAVAELSWKLKTTGR